MVPRNEGVTDGPWDSQDEKMVAAAIKEGATSAVVDREGAGSAAAVSAAPSQPCLRASLRGLALGPLFSGPSKHAALATHLSC